MDFAWRLPWRRHHAGRRKRRSPPFLRDSSFRGRLRPRGSWPPDGLTPIAKQRFNKPCSARGGDLRRRYGWALIEFKNEFGVQVQGLRHIFIRFRIIVCNGEHSGRCIGYWDQDFRPSCRASYSYQNSVIWAASSSAHGSRGTGEICEGRCQKTFWVR